MKLRQDAWTDENDLLLAETVLRHVREGSTQLNAFEEVGDRLDRTSAACGFRWNSVVRQRYEQALGLARKQRKHRQRMLGLDQGGKKKILYQPKVVEELSSNRDEDVLFSSNINERNSNLFQSSDEERINKVNNSLIRKHSGLKSNIGEIVNGVITLDDVIDFLQSQRKTDAVMLGLKTENERLRLEISDLKRKNEDLEKKVGSMKVNSSTLQEDYEALINIMNKARKMVMDDDKEELPTTKFKMDKNGNLEKIAE